MKWTNEQEEVLRVRQKNILVSAAAGSGKTAVLVERIIQMVSDAQNPIDIDRLLVVTFTNAAAAEMRERILIALEKISSNNPLNEHIQKQLSYIHNASITTIDSFCLDVIRQHFSEIDIDPAFRIGDEGELKLLQEDVLSELLERYYENGDEHFILLAEDYATGKGDLALEELVKKLYQFAMSYPYPMEWLDMCENNYHMEDYILSESKWYGSLKEYIGSLLEYCLKETDRAIKICNTEFGPIKYIDALISDREFIEELLSISDYENISGYEGRYKKLEGYKFARLQSRGMPENVSEDLKEEVKDIRNDNKKRISKIKEKYYSYSEDIIEEDMIKCSKHVKALVSLVKDFINDFAMAKRDKNIIDFSDMEHLALEILVDRDDAGNYKPSAVAKEMSKEFEEIIIDEYQDSNLLQEVILNAVSSCGYEGRNNNIFMVGDVKQSIYKFRLARPELFLEKYNLYPTHNESDCKRITLSKNFRSRREVLDISNVVFSQLMTKSLGGIEYDEDNALYYGASYEEDTKVYTPEILLLDTTKDKSEVSEDVFENEEIAEFDEDNDNTAIELEAVMAANRIKELISQGFKITDKSTGSLRTARYSDFAILLRGMIGYAKVYEEVFASKGIPLITGVGTGYFDSFEVKAILDYLSLLDNPRQDIPLVGVLRNIYRFTEDELANIRIRGLKQNKKLSYYECLLISKDEKAVDFINVFNKYREITPYTSIYDLIEVILKETGFGYFISSMQDGQKRMANINMLKEKSIAYESSSYSGLFNFIRYMERLKQYDQEQNAGDLSVQSDSVVMMTIHKSKGLEFPIVILAGLGKKFNKSDTRGSIVVHQNMGIGLNYLDSKTNIKATTLIKESIANEIAIENMSEELRVLYVAMTRAKEKLIMVGNGTIESKKKKYSKLTELENEEIPAQIILEADSFLDLLLMSLSRHNGEIDEKIIKPYDLTYTTLKEKVIKEDRKQALKNRNTSYVYDEEIKEKIKESFLYSYPYKNDLDLKGKVSVSEIKHMFMKMYDDDTNLSDLEDFSSFDNNVFETEEKLIPKFISNEEKSSGTERGNAFHRVFELIDYTRDLSGDNLKLHIEEMLEKNYITRKMYDVLDVKKVRAFLDSDIGLRMKNAARLGKLYREKQFVMGISANNVDSKYSSDEKVLVQGIIDAFFEEDGKIVVVDYKTDNVPSIKDLKARYASQLDYYAMAISNIMNMEVKEKNIYSVKFNESIKQE